MRTTYRTFEEAAVALGIKVKKKVPKSERAKKCPKCGSELRRVQGTNVLVCDMSTLSDGVLKDGTEVQVFTPCGTFVTAEG